MKNTITSRILGVLCLFFSLSAFAQSVQGPPAVKGQTRTYTYQHRAQDINLYHTWVIAPGAGTFSNGCNTKKFGPGQTSTAADVKWASKCDLNPGADILIYTSSGYPQIQCSSGYSGPNNSTYGSLNPVASGNFGILAHVSCAQLCAELQQQIYDYASGSLDPDGLPEDFQFQYRCFSIDAIYTFAISEGVDDCVHRAGFDDCN